MLCNPCFECKLEQVADKAHVWHCMRSHYDPIPFTRQLTLGMQLVAGLEYLHTGPGIAHLDVKSANVVLNAWEGDHLWLIDFGIAAKFETPQGTVARRMWR